jgi:transposase
LPWASGAVRTEREDRQTLRDWVIRFNEQGPDGSSTYLRLACRPSSTTRHKAFLCRIVEEGPIPAIHGVVRWRASDLIMRLHEEFGLSVSDDTIYRASKDLGFSHVSARPRAYKQDADAMAATGYRTASSNPSTRWSTTAATPGTRSPVSRGKSCPSPAAIGQSPVTHGGDLY